MKTLDELGILHGTDKATQHPVVIPAHGYTPHYAAAFAHLRDKPIKFLEIGVGGGESIRMWMDYFTNAKVFGVDIVKDTNAWNTKVDAIENYTYVNGDQSCPTFWGCFIADYGSNWDIIIDDGSHVSTHIITTFGALWPHIEPGGLYCIEDLNCSYGGMPSHFTPKPPTHMEWICGLMTTINQVPANDIDSIHFSKELAILTKKA